MRLHLSVLRSLWHWRLAHRVQGLTLNLTVTPIKQGEGED